MAPTGATKHPSQVGIIQTAQDGDATTSSIVVQRAATTVQHELTDTQASGSGSGSDGSQFTAKVLVPSTQDHDTASSSGGVQSEGWIVSGEDWQKCQTILEACKAETRSPPMQKHVADLSDMLQKLNKQERPSRNELRQMAKSLCVPQKKDGANIDV